MGCRGLIREQAGPPARLRPRGREGGLTLIELVVSVGILAIVTAMILVTWFALQDSYSFTSRSAKQREHARDAMSRMVREIRDSGGRTGGAAGSGIALATATRINFRSAFNDADVTNVGSDGSGDGPAYLPPLGGFYYQWDEARGYGTVYRWRDSDSSNSRTPADRAEVLVDHVVNGVTPVFEYTCLNTGSEAGLPIGSPYTTTDPTDLTTIVSVQIHLRVDLNPGSSPEYLDLTSTAQPRNHRQT
jgi:type II secretory pathway pseudopilin PulG